MRALLSLMSAFAVAATLMLPATIGAKAQTPSASQLYQTVDYRRGGRHYGARRYHGPRRHYGHRRHYGPRYGHHRRYRGPSVGVIIGGGVPYYRPAPRYIAPPVVRPVRPAYGLGRAHIDWCYARYRSYRASDNTFQPYHGGRRACYSPYS
ncbi:BA14K family protein [Pararhizobium haloflavum]|uniref:BA14K family protein n=1 Tax=Pararhizobium haloflavum TaxID=2037914 RepID=UPI000C177020|nr:BA14K family protein [Pararhizobium haloflavum]